MATRTKLPLALGVGLGLAATLAFTAAGRAWVRARGGPPPSSRIPVLEVAGGKLKLEVCSDNIVRVVFAKDLGRFSGPTLATAAKQCTPPAFTVATTPGQMTVTTARLRVRVDTATGAVSFLDSSGRTILAEKPGGGRMLTPAVVQGEQVFHVRQQWQPNPDESLYGLGQHQHGLLDIKDTDLDLRQYNTEVYIPFLSSSRGWGVLWDNTSYSKFGDLTAPVPLPGTSGLYRAGGGEPGDVDPKAGAVDWSGTVTPPVTGDYTFRTYSSGEIKVEVAGQVVIDHWRQGWLPNEDLAHVSLTEGKPVKVRLLWKSDIGVKIVRLVWKPPVAGRTTSLWSEVADGIDYHFVYGPKLDDVIAGYRTLTGQAAPLPKWAFGFWQSRERYRSAKEVLEVVKGYRDRGWPLDVIVQDWRYWPEGTWGSHQFDPQRFPDPAGMLRTLHDSYQTKFVISVWPKFYTGTANFEALNAAGFLYQPNLVEKKKDFLGHVFTYYDAFNPAARAAYWAQIRDALWSKGVDAWWMDAPEPEVVEGPFPSVEAQVRSNQTHMHPTAMGTGARMLNAYPLMNAQAIWDGQRAAAPEKPVVILTRSAFAGQQRYGAITWSGDISSTWTAFRKQIPAGLSFALSGMPYWTVDSGGFSVPPWFAHARVGSREMDEWRELNTRWFECATFLPIMRVHGQLPLREIWAFGGDESPHARAMVKFARLRERLRPYIESLATEVAVRGGTMLRPLAMDFPNDPVARAIKDEYLFGPALLVAPLTAHGARSRLVYLPSGVDWYDFWTGQNVTALGQFSAAAPLDGIPVFVRGDSPWRDRL